MHTWFALLAAPTLALIDQSIAFATAGWACAGQRHAVMHGVHAFFLLLTVAATVMAWQRWRLTAEAGDQAMARRHFLAGLAVALGALASLTIVAMWIPVWMLSPCTS